MAGGRISAGREPKGHKISAGNQPEKKRLNFNFRFWSQIENFGLSELRDGWFVALLEKLRDLSSYDVDVFVQSSEAKDAWRYHQIKWDQPNIPIQRNDLTWVETSYLDNAEEFPIYQFQITKSLGRVVGFWDEKKVFNIVLLDPLHNLQPSKAFDYKVNPSSPLACDYTILVQQVESLVSTCSDQCPHANSVTNLQTRKKELQAFGVVMVQVSDLSKLEYAQKVVDSGMATSYAEIFEYGVDQLHSEISQG